MPGTWETPGLWGSRTQAWVQTAGIAVLSMQVRTVPLKLPGVSKVHHQGLHEARGREEIVALVAIVIPTQATGLPRVDRGQLRRQKTDSCPGPQQGSHVANELVSNKFPQVKNKCLRQPSSGLQTGGKLQIVKCTVPALSLLSSRWAESSQP